MIKHYFDLIQGTEEWFAARRGLLTASEMKYAISRKTDKKTGAVTYKTPDDDKSVSHLYELAAQRTTGYVEPHYISDDMLRGKDDEVDAKNAYEKHYAKVRDCGFITNDKWGFTLGFSPDGLVGDDGFIECKGRRQKYQFETILGGVMPDEFKIQVQTGLLVSERRYCDFISYCGGMPMLTLRVEADKVVQDAIVAAATVFHEKLAAQVKAYADRLAAPGARLIPTERRVEQEILAS